MTTAQYLFQTKVNPDVVYKAYLKWLGMLTPGGEPVVREVPVARVQLRRTRPRTAAQSMHWTMVQMGSAPWACRVSQPAGVGLQGSTVDSSVGIRSGCFYPVTTTFRTIRLYIYRRKGSKCKHILWTQQSTNMSKKGNGETIKMVLKMFLGTEYGRFKLPISGDSWET